MKWIAKKGEHRINDSDDVVTKIAKIRGIKDVNRFLSPTKDEMFDPYLIKNIEDASNRIIRAIASGEKILLSYDPDADGLTATSVMYRYLKNYTDNVDYIYGERNDGHGIYEMVRVSEHFDEERKERNRINAEKIKECDLLILIDSSSNDTKTCESIAKMGKDIIIIDHHEIERENPHVLLVNPQQEGDEYPNKFLSGAGVVFKVLQVMEDTLCQVDPFQYMDLVAVGMYADVMRVDVLENRFMIMYGMRNIKNVGLTRILKGAKQNLFKVNSSTIGFTIAPLINGVARMDNIKLAIDILLTDDDNEAKKLRLQMDKLNKKRKEMQKEIISQYMTKIKSNEKALIVIDEQSSKGFNGIVAQQLTETYKRPVIVGRLHNGTISGSFRSYNGFKFKTFLNDFDGEIEAIGHEGAGGITIKEELLHSLLQYINDNLPELKDKEPTVVYDLEIDVKEVPEYVKPIQQFNLLVGNGFPKVILKVNNISIEDVLCIGETKETVKFKTFDEIELIKFRVSEEYASEISIFDSIDVVGELNVNEWYNFKTKSKVITNQIMIEDYKLSS